MLDKLLNWALAALIVAALALSIELVLLLGRLLVGGL